MAVFRIEKTRDYTVMSNHHLKDRTLTLKSKGLLSMMLMLWATLHAGRATAAICFVLNLNHFFKNLLNIAIALAFTKALSLDDKPNIYTDAETEITHRVPTDKKRKKLSSILK